MSLVGVRTYENILRPTQNPTLAGMDPLPLVTGLPVGPGFLFLRYILPVVVCPWLFISCEHRRARKEEERLVGDCAAGSPRLLMCILEHINILRDPLYFEVIALHFIMQSQEVEGMVTCSPRLDVGEKRLWSDVSVKSLCVSELTHPRVFDNGEDERRSISPRHLVGAAVASLGFVRCFRARTDDGRGIVVDCRVISANYCGFDKFRSVARCVRCHRPNESDEVVCASCFIVRDLEEDRCHDLPDLCEVGIGRLAIYRLELFKRISKFCHNFFGCHGVRRAWLREKFDSL